MTPRHIRLLAPPRTRLSVCGGGGQYVWPGQRRKRWPPAPPAGKRHFARQTRPPEITHSRSRSISVAGRGPLTSASKKEMNCRPTPSSLRLQLIPESSSRGGALIPSEPRRWAPNLSQTSSARRATGPPFTRRGSLSSRSSELPGGLGYLSNPRGPANLSGGLRRTPSEPGPGGRRRAEPSHSRCGLVLDQPVGTTARRAAHLDQRRRPRSGRRTLARRRVLPVDRVPPRHRPSAARRALRQLHRRSRRDDDAVALIRSLEKESELAVPVMVAGGDVG